MDSTDPTTYVGKGGRGGCKCDRWGLVSIHVCVYVCVCIRAYQLSMLCRYGWLVGWGTCTEGPRPVPWVILLSAVGHPPTPKHVRQHSFILQLCSSEVCRLPWNIGRTIMKRSYVQL